MDAVKLLIMTHMENCRYYHCGAQGIGVFKSKCLCPRISLEGPETLDSFIKIWASFSFSGINDTGTISLFPT